MPKQKSSETLAKIRTGIQMTRRCKSIFDEIKNQMGQKMFVYEMIEEMCEDYAAKHNIDISQIEGD